MVVRQGKALTVVRGEVTSGGKVATTALFVFGAARPSAHAADFVPPPPLDVAAPAASPSFFDGVDFRPNFTHNFEARLARGAKPATASNKVRWLSLATRLDEQPLSIARAGF